MSTKNIENKEWNACTQWQDISRKVEDTNLLIRVIKWQNRTPIKTTSTNVFQFSFFTNRVMMPVTQCINTVRLKWRRNTAVRSHWALREAEMRWLAFYSEVKYALISLNPSQQETFSLIWPLGEMSAYDTIELSHIYKQKKEKVNSLFAREELVSGDFSVCVYSKCSFFL